MFRIDKLIEMPSWACRFVKESIKRYDSVNMPRASPPRFFEKCPQLHQYQKEGISFALGCGGRCLIGDDMGLGKTLQALGIIYEYRKEWPALVITPSSVRYAWKDQVEKWLPGVKAQVICSGKDDVQIDTDIAIISYSLMGKDNRKFERPPAIAYDGVNFFRLS